MLKKIVSFIILLNFIIPFNEAHKRDSYDKEESGYSTKTVVICSATTAILGVIITKAINIKSNENDSNENKDQKAKIENLEKELQKKILGFIEALNNNQSLREENLKQRQDLLKSLNELQNLHKQRIKSTEQKIKLRLDLAWLKTWPIPKEILEKSEKDPALREDIEAIQNRIDEQIQTILKEHCS